EVHADVNSQLALPGGPPSGEFEVSFVLRAADGAYEDSEEFTIVFVPLADEGEPTPTPTPEPGPPHTSLRIGSTEPLEGKLTVESVPVAFLVPMACLGGTGDEC